MCAALLALRSKQTVVAMPRATRSAAHKLQRAPRTTPPRKLLQLQRELRLLGQAAVRAVMDTCERHRCGMKKIAWVTACASRWGGGAADLEAQCMLPLRGRCLWLR